MRHWVIVFVSIPSDFIWMSGLFDWIGLINESDFYEKRWLNIPLFSKFYYYEQIRRNISYSILILLNMQMFNYNKKEKNSDSFIFFKSALFPVCISTQSYCLFIWNNFIYFLIFPWKCSIFPSLLTWKWSESLLSHYWGCFMYSAL